LFHGVEFYIKNERALPVSEKSTEGLHTFFDLFESMIARAIEEE